MTSKIARASRGAAAGFLTALFWIISAMIAPLSCAEAGGYAPSNYIRHIDGNVRANIKKGLSKLEVRKRMSRYADVQATKDTASTLTYVISDKPDQNGVQSSVIVTIKFDTQNKVLAISTDYVNSGP